ncbi:MAG: hypothetical protein JWM19_1616 [Actinomycetia bacterium]|nr:hypothetical protein [Actinomycetes bacterium]
MVDTKAQLKQVKHGTTKMQQQAATAAAAGVNSAAQLAAQGVQQAAEGVTAGLRASTDGVRSWAAPRLESAADYTTSTMAPAVSKAMTKEVAPRVSAALRKTARQVSPDKRSRLRVRPALAWTALTVTVLAAAGAAGSLLWRRYRPGVADDSRLDAVTYPAADSDAMTPESTPSEDGMNPPVPDPAQRAR